MSVALQKIEAMNQSYDTTTPEDGGEFLSLRDFVAPEGLATLRVSFPFPLAAGALAKQLKLMALRPWAFPAQVLTGASS